MVRLRVQSMQADVPVGSGGSTCSPFPNVHSFHTVATALHYKDTQKHAQTKTAAAAMHSDSRGFLLL